MGLSKPWHVAIGGLVASVAMAQAPTLTLTSNLDFGAWVIQSNGASVTMNASSGVVTASRATGTGALPITLAAFSATGTPGRSFTIYTSLSGSNTNIPFTLTGQSSGQTITANAYLFPTNLPSDTGTFNGGGTASFTLGGQLTNLATTLADDTYTGVLPVFLQDQSGASSAGINLLVTIHLQTGLAISKLADLDFGDIITLGSAGQVSLSPAQAAPTFTGGVQQGPRVGSLASFLVIGKTGGKANSRNYQITFQGSGTAGQGSVTLTDPLTSDTMTAALRSYIGNTQTAQGNLDATSGQQQFTVGGTLTVKATQNEGDYSGAFVVSVTYN